LAQGLDQFRMRFQERCIGSGRDAAQNVDMLDAKRLVKPTGQIGRTLQRKRAGRPKTHEFPKPQILQFSNSSGRQSLGFPLEISKHVVADNALYQRVIGHNLFMTVFMTVEDGWFCRTAG
jgi:hypothetical protein